MTCPDPGAPAVCIQNQNFTIKPGWNSADPQILVTDTSAKCSQRLQPPSQDSASPAKASDIGLLVIHGVPNDSKNKLCLQMSTNILFLRMLGDIPNKTADFMVPCLVHGIRELRHGAGQPGQPGQPLSTGGYGIHPLFFGNGNRKTRMKQMDVTSCGMQAMMTSSTCQSKMLCRNQPNDIHWQLGSHVSASCLLMWPFWLEDRASLATCAMRNVAILISQLQCGNLAHLSIWAPCCKCS